MMKKKTFRKSLLDRKKHKNAKSSKAKRWHSKNESRHREVELPKREVTHDD
jgi:hypothetical protein